MFPIGNRDCGKSAIVHHEIILIIVKIVLAYDLFDLMMNYERIQQIGIVTKFPIVHHDIILIIVKIVFDCDLSDLMKDYD